MKLTKLRLKHFRNIEALTLVPHPRVNLILGPNASGKTNLCEALYYASRGLLLKGERQRELIHWAHTWSALDLEVGPEHIRIVLDGAERGKALELSGEPVTQAQVFEVFKVLIFTPDDLQVIKGSPAQRRRALDRGIADLHGPYRAALLAYDQVVRRKNALLRHERLDPELLVVYDEELVRHGARLVRERLRHLEALNAHLAPLHRGLTRPGTALTLRYESNVPYEEGHLSALSARLAEALRRHRPQERRRGMSLVGPHRDDVRFDLEGVDLRRFGSQGQQKTALIALKLAQLELFHARLDDYPVLVLDDVLSELDPQRTQLLLDHLPHQLQLFLTETELSPPLARRADRVFQVERGVVRERRREDACA